MPMHALMLIFLIILQSLFLSTLGGDTTTARTNKILKYVFTNELAKSFNFAGQKNKEAFEKLSLKTVVVRKFDNIKYFTKIN